MAKFQKIIVFRLERGEKSNCEEMQMGEYWGKNPHGNFGWVQ